MHYQPLVTPKGKIAAVEALVRWNSPELGFVSPGAFIPVAEESGLIVPVGDWILRQACRDGQAWRDAGLPEFAVAINVAAEQFMQRDFVDCVREALSHSGLEPRFLEVELTERTVMSDADAVVRVLQELKDVGVELSVDDFGTGYSSLAYLSRFPIDILKIDVAFVRGLPEDTSSGAITGAIIAMAHGLNLHTVAEGVETEEQRAFLEMQGCDILQGWYFAKAMPSDELVQWIERTQAEFAQ